MPVALAAMTANFTGVEYNLLDGLTFDDLILAVHCNCQVVTRAAVHAELNHMLASRRQDMNFLLEKNMDAIIAAALKGREQCG